MSAGPSLPETQVERSGEIKERKRQKDKNVENYTHPKTKNKRDQVERQLGDPRWDENLDASAKDGEDCVWPLDDQDLPSKPSKK